MVLDVGEVVVGFGEGHACAERSAHSVSSKRREGWVGCGQGRTLRTDGQDACGGRERWWVGEREEEGVVGDRKEGEERMRAEGGMKASCC